MTSSPAVKFISTLLYMYYIGTLHILLTLTSLLNIFFAVILKNWVKWNRSNIMSNKDNKQYKFNNGVHPYIVYNILQYVKYYLLYNV